MLEQLQEPAWPGIPKHSSEYITLIAHYYRAEMARMSGWRDRIDRTTNWAITVAGAMLSVSLSTPTAHHGVLLFAMILVLLFLVIEARRYSRQLSRLLRAHRKRPRCCAAEKGDEIASSQKMIDPHVPQLVRGTIASYSKCQSRPVGLR